MCIHALVINGQCHIEQDSVSAVGTPTFEGQSQTTYSCVADENCNYDVHIISNYEGNGHTGFRVHNTGTTNVDINVSVQGPKALVLVFVSYEPVNWILDIPRGVVIDKVLLVRNQACMYMTTIIITVDHTFTHRDHTSWKNQTLPTALDLY